MNNDIPPTIAEYIQQQLDNIQEAEEMIKNRILEIGSRKVAEMTEIDQTTLSAFANGNRRFSNKRLLYIAEKIF